MDDNSRWEGPARELLNVLRTGLATLEQRLGAQDQALSQINEKLGAIMAAQDDINAAVTSLQQVSADLLAAVQNIQAQLANGAQPDTTQLDAGVAALQQADAAIQALETPAAPPVAPPAS